MKTTPEWLLLVVSLPTQSTTARMRVWRALKALGCMALRDGAYLLPGGAESEQRLREVANECTREGGVAWLMSVLPASSGEASGYRELFDRTDDYLRLRKSWKEANRGLAKLSSTQLARLQRRFQREYEALRGIDFFPGDATAEAEAAWLDFNNRLNQLVSPGEPHRAKGAVARRNASDFRGRTWATRRRLWVDRVASAWLIKRFIDPHARFKWLARPSDCPKSAVGFDFDGATFTHVGDRVTFETLLASFGLEGDPGLAKLGVLIHQLDVGGEPLPEAAGFEAVITGARERLNDDDALLAEMSVVLDSLHAHFGRDKRATT